MPFPKNLQDWNEDSIQKLITINYEEDQYIEYKSQFFPTNKPTSEVKADIQKEFCGFANAEGGFIIFGIDNKEKPYQLKSINFEGEINLKFSELLSNTKPIPEFKINRLVVEGKNIFIVYISPSKDKPVQCENGSFYMRFNGKTEPIQRVFLQDWFVSKEVKQQLYGKLLFEINYTKELANEVQKRGACSNLPPFYKMRLKNLQESLSAYHYLYTNSDATVIITKINQLCADIQLRKEYFDLQVNIHLSARYGLMWTDLNSFYNTMAGVMTDENTHLANIFPQLKAELERLEKYL